MAEGGVRRGVEEVQVPDTAGDTPRNPTIFDCAKNFILTERKSDGRYVPALNEEVLAELAQVKEKLVVVSAVGAYRTGKSYLLSRLSRRGGGKPFCVGHSSRPQTKGLWLMITDHPAIPGYKLALIDTEGIGDTEKGDRQHDTAVFVLTCLLSDSMIYNGKTSIDESAFEKLGFTAEMSNHLVSKKKKDGDVDDESQDEVDNLKQFFPELIYVVRDFSLDLEGEDGQEITPDEYFENALAIKAHEDPANPRTKVRKCIKKYFTRRKCFTLDPPAASKSTLKTMDSISDEELNPDFLVSLTHLCNYVLVEGNSTTLQNGRKVNGEQVATLVKTYVSALRSNEVPNVSSAMETLKKNANKKALDNAEQEYQMYGEKFVQEHMPTETMEDVEKAHGKIAKVLTDKAQQEAILEDTEVQEFVAELENRLNAKKEYFTQENKRLSEEACMRILKELYQPIEAKKCTTYNKPKGHQLYRQDVKALKEKYNAVAGLGVMKEEVLAKYFGEKAVDDETILAMDNALSETEKKILEEQLIAQREKEKVERLEREAEAKEKEIKTREKHAIEMKETMEKAMEKEREERKRTDDYVQELRKQFEQEKQDESRRFEVMLQKQQEQFMKQQEEQDRKNRDLEAERREEARRLTERLDRQHDELVNQRMENERKNEAAEAQRREETRLLNVMLEENKKELERKNEAAEALRREETRRFNERLEQKERELERKEANSIREEKLQEEVNSLRLEQKMMELQLQRRPEPESTCVIQ